jgi:hypothetical protein
MRKAPGQIPNGGSDGTRIEVDYGETSVVRPEFQLRGEGAGSGRFVRRGGLRRQVERRGRFPYLSSIQRYWAKIHAVQLAGHYLPTIDEVDLFARRNRESKVSDNEIVAKYLQRRVIASSGFQSFGERMYQRLAPPSAHF